VVSGGEGGDRRNREREAERKRDRDVKEDS
jgi:hypothetical protein